MGAVLAEHFLTALGKMSNITDMESAAKGGRKKETILHPTLPTDALRNREISRACGKGKRGQPECPEANK